MKKRIIHALSVSLFLLTLLFLPAATPRLFGQDETGSQNRLDSIAQALVSGGHDGSERLAGYCELMWEYLGIDIGKSEEYAHSGLEIAVALDQWQAASECYILLGIAHGATAEYEAAMEWYGKALEATAKMADFPKKYSQEDMDDMYAIIYGNMANLHSLLGNYHEAIDSYKKGLVLFEKYGWTENQALAYGSIGNIYRTLNNFEQAEINLLRADTLAHELGDSLQIAISKERIGNLYVSTREWDKALENTMIAHDHYAAHPGVIDNNAAVYASLAQIYMDGFGDDSKAEEYARQALKSAEEVGIVHEKAIALAILARIAFQRGEYRKAEQTALEAIAIDDSSIASSFPLYEVLSKVYSHLGNPDLADHYFDRYDELRNQWATNHYQAAIREMEIKYETDKREAAIADLKEEKGVIRALYISISGLLLLGLAAMFLLWRWSAQKKRISEQQVIQLEQEKRLIATQAVFDGEVQERIRLARDLHDGLGSILAAAKYNFTDIKKTSGEQPLDMERYDVAIGLLDESMREMRRVAHHLMPESLSNSGLRRSIADFCTAVPHVTFNWYGEESRFDANMEVIIYRIMHELVSNALKHSGASRILVEVVRYDDHIALTVEDNGCGFDPMAATQGMGLQNIRARIAAHKGQLLVDSKSGVGTEINVELRIES